jgi:hypothetical protein
MFIFRKKKDTEIKGSQTPACRSSSEVPSFSSIESSLARVIALENILVGSQKPPRQSMKSVEKRHFQVLLSEKVPFSEKANVNLTSDLPILSLFHQDKPQVIRNPSRMALQVHV